MGGEGCGDIASMNFLLRTLLRQRLWLDEWNDDLVQDNVGMDPSMTNTFTNKSFKGSTMRAVTSPQGGWGECNNLLEDWQEVSPQEISSCNGRQVRVLSGIGWKSFLSKRNQFAVCRVVSRGEGVEGYLPFGSRRNQSIFEFTSS